MLTRSSHPRLLVTQAEMRTWLAGAKGGDILEYHRGVLTMDRLPQGSRLPANDRSELDRLARAVLAIAGSGRGYLLQRRNGKDDYSYLLVVISKPSLRTSSPALAEEAAS